MKFMIWLKLKGSNSVIKKSRENYNIAKRVLDIVSGEIIYQSNREKKEMSKDYPSLLDKANREQQIEIGRQLFLEDPNLDVNEIRNLGYYVPVGYNIEKRNHR